MFPLALWALLLQGACCFLWFHDCLAFLPNALPSGRLQTQNWHERNIKLKPVFMKRQPKDEDTNEHFGFGDSSLRKLWVPSNNSEEGKGKDYQNKSKTRLSGAQQPKSAPVYITIGPPCAGKTSALRMQLEQDGYDPDLVLLNQKKKSSSEEIKTEVALDEQSNVYQRIPLAGFLFPATRLDPQLANTTLDDSGTTVRDRLCSPSTPRLESTDAEIRNIILRVAGRMTPQEFADRAREQALQAGDTVKFFRDRRMQIAEDLIVAVERVSVQAVGEILFQMQLQQEDAGSDVALTTTTGDVSVNELPYHDKDETTMSSPSSSSLPEHNLTAVTNATSAQLLSARALIRTPYVDLFVPHAIFSSGGGLDRAELQLQELLTNLPPTTPVSWGNTNTKPAEYVAALRAAQTAGRPVKFIAWGVSPFLHYVSRQELLRRTVSKFRNTGRYIPAGAVGAAAGRVEWLIREAAKEVGKLLDGEIAMNENDSRQDDDATALDNNYRSEDEHKFNVAFAALAGFAMDEEGRVVRIAQPRTPNQRFHSKKGKGRNKKDSKDRRKVRA